MIKFRELREEEEVRLIAEVSIITTAK